MKIKTKASALLIGVLLLAGILAILLPQGLSAAAMENTTVLQNNSVVLKEQKCDYNHDNDYIEFVTGTEEVT